MFLLMNSQLFVSSKIPIFFYNFLTLAGEVAFKLLFFYSEAKHSEAKSTKRIFESKIIFS